MSIEKVRAFLEERGMAEKIREFSVSSATVALAAEALGVPGERIAKTLSFLVNDAPVLIVTAGDKKIDNPKFKAAFGTKAKMLTPEQAETMVGHAVGGVCPFAVNPGCRVYLDESLKRFDVVYPAAGSASSAVELTVPQLEALTGYPRWIDVCK